MVTGTVLNIHTCSMSASKKLAQQYKDFNFIDTTVKSGIKALAPTWGMVKAYKEGMLTEEEYTVLYRNRMVALYPDNHEVWYNIVTSNENIVLMCYCGEGKFCHRHLLAKMFNKLATELKMKPTICGELKPLEL